jgi:hypothetical protein
LLVLLALAAAWKLGMLDRGIAEDPALESGMTSLSPRRQTEPPRIKSTQFRAACAAPAPVYVYESDRTPAAFLVLLAKPRPDPEPASDPARVADSLARHYELRSSKYDGSVHGFVVEAAGPGIVSRLRCEPAVSALEESAISR